MNTSADIPPRTHHHWFHTLAVTALVFLVGLLMFTWKLGNAPLSGTEGHRAITAHQMNQSHQYLVPTLYGWTYLKKPPLQYWILAAFEWITHHANEWVWRLPSAISAALLAAVIVLFTARWHTLRAGLIAGFAQLALIALWSQSRSADIDANHTLAAVLTGLLLIDQLWLAQRPSWPMCTLLAISFTAALMLKGPACLPVVLGAIIGPAIFTRQWRSLLRLRIWLALVVGLSLFAWWAIAAANAVFQGNLPIDAGGLAEAQDRLYITSWRQLGRALLLPFTIFAYGLPVSLGLLVPFLPSLRRQLDARTLHISLYLSAATITGLILCTLSGMTNPRYAYILLPLLAPIVGILGDLWHRSRLSASTSQALNTAQFITTIALFIFGAILLYQIHDKLSLATSTPHLRSADGKLTSYQSYNKFLSTALILWALPLGIIAAITIIPAARGHLRRSAIPLGLLLIVTALLFGNYNQYRRSAKSGYTAGLTLKSLIPPDAPLTVWYTLWAQPEVLYYADANAHPQPLGTTHENLPAGWVLFYDTEFMRWRTAFPDRLSRITRLPLSHKDAYLAWYQPPREPTHD